MQIVATSGTDTMAADKIRSAKVVDGAHQFEAMLVEQMLKPLHFGLAPGDADDEAAGANGSLQGYATEALAKGIVKGGGFGLSREIVRQVSAEAHASDLAKGGKVL